MTTMKVVLSNVDEANKVVSILNAKGIGKNEITVKTPNFSDLKNLKSEQIHDDNQEIKMFAWMSAIGGAAIFTLLSFMLLMLFNLNSELSLATANFDIVPGFILFGLLIGGVIGYFLGSAVGSNRNKFKRKKVSMFSSDGKVQLNFKVPEIRKEELEQSIKVANPLFVEFQTH